MSKNLIPDILKKLGVEYGEKFQIYAYGTELYKGSLFFFDKDYGLTMVKSNGSRFNADNMIYGIMCGHYEIVKLRWEPKRGESYYAINIADTTTPYIAWHAWNGYVRDYISLQLGIIYKTKEEAEAHMAEDYERLTGKPLDSSWVATE